MDSIEQEERAKLWHWIEYMEWELDPEYVEQMVQMAVQARQIQSVMDLVNQYTVNTYKVG
jgi:hypothetical protein